MLFERDPIKPELIESNHHEGRVFNPVSHWWKWPMAIWIPWPLSFFILSHSSISLTPVSILSKAQDIFISLTLFSFPLTLFLILGNGLFPCLSALLLARYQRTSKHSLYSLLLIYVCMWQHICITETRNTVEGKLFKIYKDETIESERLCIKKVVTLKFILEPSNDCDLK